MRKVYEHILEIKGSLITLDAPGAALGELARIQRRDGRLIMGSVIAIHGSRVTLQLFDSARGISTQDRVCFLKRPVELPFSMGLLGRRLSGSLRPLDGGEVPQGVATPLAGPSFNPVRRTVPHEMVRTNIPMIDLFNCLVKSQKLPIFSLAGQPYNELLMRIAGQTDADVVVVGGMGLTFDDEALFINAAQEGGRAERTLMFLHTALDPVVECLLIPDMALAAAESFASKGMDVLVLLSDMTAFADAIKEVAITMDQVPSNRGYPGSLYSDLALRYERAVAIDQGGSITIIAVTTMPGDDVTHPIPDNTGYITEGQLYLHQGRIDPFGSLSRLKQQVIGKVTRHDHGELANAMIRLYAESKKAHERESMGFKLTAWDQKLLSYSRAFESQMMNLKVNMPIEKALDLGWKILSSIFEPQEVGIKENLIQQFWLQRM